VSLSASVGAADPRISPLLDHGLNDLYPPIPEPYLRAWAKVLAEAWAANMPRIMLSSGVWIARRWPGRNPCGMSESGPAAVALAAAHYAEAPGLERLLSFDMGHHGQGLSDE